VETSSSVTQETEPELSREAWQISKPSKPTSRSITYHISPSSQNEKPIKVIIRHLPENTLAEDISDGLVSLGFDDINVKQMTTTRHQIPKSPRSFPYFSS
jgi:hypothetical protein